MEGFTYAIFVYDLDGSCEKSFYFKDENQALNDYDKVLEFMTEDFIGDFEAVLYKIPHGVCHDVEWETIFTRPFTIE